jgi:DNA mismatch repair ATPase MutL
LLSAGIGISRDDLETRIGQFGFTNKHVHGDTYGCKGEALAAISRLAMLEIRSRPRNSNTVNRIVIGNGSATSSDFEHYFSSGGGTTIVVTDIFRHLPVRRKALRANLEVHHIREMVKRYSVCHKDIRFSLYDFGRQKLLLATAPCQSVLDRLESYHDPRLVRALEVLSFISCFFRRFVNHWGFLGQVCGC